MTKHTISIFILGVLSACLALGTAEAATSYNYTDLQFPGAMGTTPTEINNSGTIAGYYWDTNYFAHGFVYSGGAFTQVDAPGAKASGTLSPASTTRASSPATSSRRREGPSASPSTEASFPITR